MKKSLIISALLAGAIAFSATAQDSDSAKSLESGRVDSPHKDFQYPLQMSALNYRNARIYRVIDHPDAYIVLYQRNSHEMAEVTIPKAWYAMDGKKQQKLQFRPIYKGVEPYITVFSRDGNFDHVVLSMPLSRRSSYWTVADSDTKVSDLEKESITLEY